jgi:dUTP pyrophosphatase
MLQIKRLHPEAKLPVRSTNYAAGYDLFALNDGVIEPRNKTIIKTGIAIRIPQPKGYNVYGSIRSRSGLSAKYNLEVGAGVIDFDYEKDVGIILYNHSDILFRYNAGDRIAQLVLEMHITPEIVEVADLQQTDSNRDGGFGSTGI